MPAVGEAIAPAIRAEFERDVLTARARDGHAFRALPLVRSFAAKHGVAPATLYRWIGALPATDILAPPREMSAAALGIPPSDALVGGDDRRSGPEPLPPQPLARIPPGASPIPNSLGVAENLAQIIQAALDVMQRARRAPRDLDQARVLLQACEVLRRGLETAIKLHDQVWTLVKLDRFHEAIIAAVRQHSPAAADEILAQLELIARDWAQADPAAAP